ncbi:MAG: 16S rRNA (cytosine(967)-C(5))-methyltransferase RsmB [Pseudomonadales bacterium]|nr:16S rRNA (cytosine(967)-C(5))-methyltransferase RsmB [Pseudomonadales bacterium]
MKDVRALAAKSIARVISQGESFSAEIDALSKSNQNAADKKPSDNIENKDRAFYRELCFGTLRHFHRLDAQLKPLLKKPFSKKDADIHALLLIGLYQLLYLRTPDHAAISASVDAAKKLKKQWASGLVNAVLRNFLRQQAEPDKVKALSQAADLSHPKWLLNKIQKDWPNNWQPLIDYNNAAPPMSLRVNLNKNSRADFQQQLADAGIETIPDPHSDSGLRLNQAVAVSALPDFDQGAVSVQDLGAQLAATLLNVDDSMQVLDACAAPGGKTVHILESAPKCQLTSIDSSSERFLRVKENLARYGFSANCIAADAGATDLWWDEQMFDRILLDAPCSGTGIISHHPDIKLIRRSSDLAQFAEQQKTLLTQLWPLLKDGGQLLYCTCSIMPEENAAVIDWFLNQMQNANAEIIDAQWGVISGSGHQLLPNKGKNGGFFYARLSKSATL